MSSTPSRGSCVCGAVRYLVEGPFGGFKYCHCSRCRKASGSAHCANLFAGPESVRFEAGEEQVKRYDLPEAKHWSRAFCATCASHVPFLARSGKAWVIPAGSLDDDPGHRPDSNIQFGSRAPWYTPTAELPHHDEYG